MTKHCQPCGCELHDLQGDVCGRCLLANRCRRCLQPDSLQVGHHCDGDDVCGRCLQPLQVLIVAVDARGALSTEQPCPCLTATASHDGASP